MTNHSALSSTHTHIPMRCKRPGEGTWGSTRRSPPLFRHQMEPHTPPSFHPHSRLVQRYAWTAVLTLSGSTGMGPLCGQVERGIMGQRMTRPQSTPAPKVDGQKPHLYSMLSAPFNSIAISSRGFMAAPSLFHREAGISRAQRYLPEAPNIDTGAPI